MDVASSLRVLLVEDHPGDARLIQETLAEVQTTRFEIERADRLAATLERLAKGGIDVVLLDLSLPDSHGFDTFLKVRAHTPRVPIVVLSGLDDETLAMRAVKEGAQDYLVKGHVDSNLLIRALQYAMTRHQLQEELRALSLIDELTGLHNRRGFLALAQQQVKLANRTKRPFLLLMADVDGLKTINDTCGHATGDLALTETATVLKATFRDSDIVARLGGDEFAALLIEADARADSALITERLHQQLTALNAQPNRRHLLSISAGIALYDPHHPSSIEELLTQADALMYSQKRRPRDLGAAQTPA
ncbi:MAG: diguanylate cyclase [Candidatus Omnitrophica bacterium]|nr:diguanylate cyclase [Candidatus Omnitrophota bacterium]